MAKRNRADEVRQLFNLSNSWTRKQWEIVNQKGYEFAHDEQMSQDEKNALEEQGMPTFTINRILPVVEMLNFYATANNPRWQAIGTEGSDTDLAAVMSDLSDYIWSNSEGTTLYTNAINDCVTKGIGYLLVSVDKDADNGMGEVVIQNPEPFDIYVDPKSRDMLFKDAAYIMIRKVLPKNHLIKLFPAHKAKINKSNSDESSQKSFSVRALGDEDQKLFMYNDSTEQNSQAVEADGQTDLLCEYFEVYEKIKIAYVNLFYRIPPDPEVMKQLEEQCQIEVQKMAEELQVQFLEQQQQMDMALQEGKMLPERYELEINKAQEMMQQQLQAYQQECMGKLQAEASKIENIVISEKEFKVMLKNPIIADNVVDAIKFYSTRVQQTIVV